MAKTDTTLALEKRLYKDTNKIGVFRCFEVTIGIGGKERVDYITYDTKGIWRCYEIKISKSDFYSKAKKSFVGHYNYYAMPYELYKEVENDIPKEIGIYCPGGIVKNAKKQTLKLDEDVLKLSMIRSLSRENDKFIKTCDTQEINRLKNKIANLENQIGEINNKCIKKTNIIQTLKDKYGIDRKEMRKIEENLYEED